MGLVPRWQTLIGLGPCLPLLFHFYSCLKAIVVFFFVFHDFCCFCGILYLQYDSQDKACMVTDLRLLIPLVVIQYMEPG